MSRGKKDEVKEVPRKVSNLPPPNKMPKPVEVEKFNYVSQAVFVLPDLPCEIRTKILEYLPHRAQAKSRLVSENFYVIMKAIWVQKFIGVRGIRFENDCRCPNCSHSEKGAKWPENLDKEKIFCLLFRDAECQVSISKLEFCKQHYYSFIEHLDEYLVSNAHVTNLTIKLSYPKMGRIDCLPTFITIVQKLVDSEIWKSGNLESVDLKLWGTLHSENYSYFGAPLIVSLLGPKLTKLRLICLYTPESTAQQMMPLSGAVRQTRYLTDIDYFYRFENEPIAAIECLSNSFSDISRNINVQFLTVAIGPESSIYSNESTAWTNIPGKLVNYASLFDNLRGLTLGFRINLAGLKSIINHFPATLRVLVISPRMDMEGYFEMFQTIFDRTAKNSDLIPDSDKRSLLLLADTLLINGFFERFKSRLESESAVRGWLVWPEKINPKESDFQLEMVSDRMSQITPEPKKLICVKNKKSDNVIRLVANDASKSAISQRGVCACGCGTFPKTGGK